MVCHVCLDLSPDLHLRENSHLGLEVSGGLVGYHFNFIAEWGQGHFLGPLGLFYDRNIMFWILGEACFVLF